MYNIKNVSLGMLFRFLDKLCFCYQYVTELVLYSVKYFLIGMKYHATSQHVPEGYLSLLCF